MVKRSHQPGSLFLLAAKKAFQKRDAFQSLIKFVVLQCFTLNKNREVANKAHKYRVAPNMPDTTSLKLGYVPLLAWSNPVSIDMNCKNIPNIDWLVLQHVTLWLFKIAMENDPFIDDVPTKSDYFPWLC